MLILFGLGPFDQRMLSFYHCDIPSVRYQKPQSDLVMRTQVQRTASRCFAAVCQLRLIRRLVSATTLQTLVVTLVLVRMDCGNGVLVGLPTYLMRRLQSVQRAAAWDDFQSEGLRSYS
jgi:hypothetical protein